MILLIFSKLGTNVNINALTTVRDILIERLAQTFSVNLWHSY
jgi:hypothetical protein